MNQMSIINLNEQTVLYLTNALGEETGHKQINENLYDWYTNLCADSEWLQYLVELNGEVGMLAIQEITHLDSDDWDNDKDHFSEAWRNSSRETIWTHVEEVAQKVAEKIDFSVILGKETGFLARHEVCIWFPASTDKKSVEETFDKVKDIHVYY